MKRRTVLQGLGAAGAATTLGAFPMPALAQSNPKVLRFVPHANLANFDPIWGTQYVVRNAAVLVWDTLYGIDSKFQPKRQMAAGEEVSADGKTWTFKLRAGLKFHDGGAVTAKDVVASLDRWMARDPMGLMIKALKQELVAVDDATVKLVLSAPYPKMLFALGKNNTPVAFIMPERIAKTDPFKQIEEFVGSGPMKFARSEFVPGAKAVFERFADYSGAQEKADWLSGNKTMSFDRVEWIIMPDPATASAALQNGEIDWWENPIADLVPVLKRNRNVKLDIADPLGNIGSFRMNHLHAPFNNIKVRKAVQMAVNQEDYMRAIVGDDNALWQPCPGFITPGTPLYTEVGSEAMNKGKGNLEAAKKLLAESGYKGEKVICVVGQDLAPVKAMGEITADLLKRLGMTVDFVATDWGTVGQRRASKSPPDQGGWSMIHTWHAGADCVNPASYTAIRANGDKAWFGWPTNDDVEKEVTNWFGAKDAAEEKAAIDRMNKAAMDHVVYVPTGLFRGYQAWRSNLEGVGPGPLPFFWNVKKA
jgi:peptide/nickel transport system substrate-binding protein